MMSALPAGAASVAVAITLLVLLVLAAVWVGWRRRSRRAVLPCPAELEWLVEIENPLARATRSEAVVRLLAPRPGDRVADIGCGPGRVAIPLARAVGPGGEVVALDVQAGMLARVAERAAEAGLANIRLVQADARSAAIPAGSLAAATLVMALGEIPDGAAVLPAIGGALRPGGRLLVAESVFDPHFVGRRRLRAMAQAAGFVERAIEGNVFGYAMVLERVERAHSGP